MSVDHSVVTERPSRDPLFLHVKAGMTVIVEENGDWWMADVIHVIGSVKNPKHPSSFQVADVETRVCLLYTSPSPRDQRGSRMPSSA